MRILKWLAPALAVAAFAGLPVHAASPSLGTFAAAAPPLVQVAVKCGPHAHYIRGHRARNGEWIKGRCIRDRRR